MCRGIYFLDLMNAAVFLPREGTGQDSKKRMSKFMTVVEEKLCQFRGASQLSPELDQLSRSIPEKYLDILENHLLPWIDQHYDGQPVRFIQNRSPHLSTLHRWFNIGFGNIHELKFCHGLLKVRISTQFRTFVGIYKGLRCSRLPDIWRSFR